MDDADRAEVRIEAMVDDAIAKAHRLAEKIEPGEPGDCDLCGEWCGRLVRGICASCRDRYRLP